MMLFGAMWCSVVLRDVKSCMLINVTACCMVLHIVVCCCIVLKGVNDVHNV